MRDLWLISDTHFSHRSILTFRDNDSGELIRGQFDSVEQMNEHMIDCWNSVVKNGDLVYHLGDVAFNVNEQLPKLMARLKGDKRLIVGNHDNIKRIAKQDIFKKIQMWRMFPEFNLLFSHVPVHPTSLRRGAPTDPTAKIMTNCHGHIHQNPSPEGPYFNVSVEAINYTPIHIDEVLKRIREKNNV